MACKAVNDAVAPNDLDNTLILCGLMLRAGVFAGEPHPIKISRARAAHRETEELTILATK